MMQQYVVVTEKLKEKWRWEQEYVASNIVILEDDGNKSTTECILPGYECVSLVSDQNSSYYYGGVDVSFSSTSSEEDDDEQAVAVYCILNQACEIVYLKHEIFCPTIPYISSFLAFREIEPIQRLVQRQLEERPDLTPKVILVDGNGRLHTRSAGIACFVGLRTKIASIGVAKTFFHHEGLTTKMVAQGVTSRIQRLIGKELGNEFNNANTIENPRLIIDNDCICASTSLDNASNTFCNADDASMDALAKVCQAFAVRLQGEHQNIIWGAAFVGHGRTQKRSAGTKRPIYISVGHGLSLKEALVICAKLCKSSRVPEPIRVADLHGRQLMRDLHTLTSTI